MTEMQVRRGLLRRMSSMFYTLEYRAKLSWGLIVSKLTGAARKYPSRKLADAETLRVAFDHFYENPSLAAWEIGKPQPEFFKLGEAGLLKGDLLDVGCGSGEHAIYAASLGCRALGIDYSAQAVRVATEKAARRESSAEFQVTDARKLEALGRQFDTAIDAGTFHVLSDTDRIQYVQSLHDTLRPNGMLYLLCLSEFEPNSPGARLITQKDIRTAFRHGWEVQQIRSAIEHFGSKPTRRVSGFTTTDDGKAWLCFIRRLP